MEFRISDTFTGSMARLTNDEQKLVKTTAFDLQLNPANPGHQLHKLDGAKDKHFWSVRVGQDIRLIVHKSAGSLLLCYVDHHDKAYAWAERRKIERHPTTGAAQLVEIRERVQDIIIPNYVEETRNVVTKLLFAEVKEDQLLAYGVPAEWLGDVKLATEETLFDLAEHLPREAAEALLNIATGSTPPIPAQTPAQSDPFNHPDALQRFRLMTNVDELERALDAPWEKWSVFLHPAQEDLVKRRFNGPARVQGSAGTGKTIVALHRAVHLARSNPNARGLLTTFSDKLASSLKSKLQILVGSDQQLMDRIVVQPIDEVGIDLYTRTFGVPNIAADAMLQKLISEAAASADRLRFGDQFLWNEWRDVVDAWQLKSWEPYRDVNRLGRKTKLGENQRRTVWRILSEVQSELARRKLLTMAGVFAAVTAKAEPEFDFAVIDEAQDISIAQLRFIASIVRNKSLFFAGDLGQQIFQTPFSWASLGVDLRGRSRSLKINYRTSHQIRRKADRLLHQPIVDVDGIADDRGQPISVFNGVEPTIRILATVNEEAQTVAAWLSRQMANGVLPNEIAIFVRSDNERMRAVSAIRLAGLAAVGMVEDTNQEQGITIGTMHDAKGLEFRSVVVMACDDEIIPLQARVESISDASDLEEVYATERHLLYVACTRARDHLLVTAVKPGSEFLDDMR